MNASSQAPQKIPDDPAKASPTPGPDSSGALEPTPALDRAEALRDSVGHCADCTEPLTGRFCATCGQKAITRPPSVLNLFGDFLSTYLTLEGRLLQTLWRLVTRPGALTKEYLFGRRTRYVRPVALYALTSLLFFAALQVGPPLWSGEMSLNVGEVGFRISRPEGSSEVTTKLIRGGESAPATEWAQAADAEAEGSAPLGPEASRADGTGLVAAAPTSNEAPPNEAPPSIVETAETPDESRYTEQTLRAGGEIDGWLAEGATARAEQLFTSEKGRQSYLSALLSNLPRAAFFLIPLLALVMRLSYWRPSRLYAEHVVFALHFQSFFFLGVVVTIALHGWLGAKAWAGLVLLAGPAYALLALRRAFGQAWGWTVLKTTLFLLGYLVSGAVVLVVLVMASLWLA